jgi:hypothetical protein
MFTSIKEQMQNLNFTLPPSIVLIDFEIALRQSVQLQFPIAYIKGCYFHFTQCLYRWIQTHGLAIDYRESTSNIRTFVSNCAALAFLPPANVRLAFASVSGAQDQLGWGLPASRLIRLCHHSSRLIKLCHPQVCCWFSLMLFHSGST